MTQTIPVRGISRELSKRVLPHMRRSRIDQVLVANAKRRIDARGDSTHRYVELWSTLTGLGFRSGGQPLRDTGTLVNGLHSESRIVGNSLILTLKDGSGYGVLHQRGFKTNGPNFIPLTIKARRTHKKGADPATEGLKRGVDYVMAWKGVDVPQRKIFNTPPEDIADIREAVRAAIKGLN